MDNTKDHTLEICNRVYDTSGIAPTLNTGGGGGHEAKIIDVYKLDKDKKEWIYIV
jgi:hypothetical protein